MSIEGGVHMLIGDKGNDMSNQAIALTECSSESPRSVRENVRQQLTSDVESFLSNGGQVQTIDDNVRADPPKKPNMTYGSAPI